MHCAQRMWRPEPFSSARDCNCLHLAHQCQVNDRSVACSRLTATTAPSMAAAGLFYYHVCWAGGHLCNRPASGREAETGVATGGQTTDRAGARTEIRNATPLSKVLSIAI